ncbi:MAG: hypothetical protein ACRCW0_06830 [Clostridium sp.]
MESIKNEIINNINKIDELEVIQFLNQYISCIINQKKKAKII